MYDLLPYIFIVFIFIIIILYAYIRIKYRFWFYQPVFHVYNWWYLFAPPGILQHELPVENKYTNFKNIDTSLFDELSDLQMQRFVHFINANYLQNKDNIYIPKKENIVPYFTSHNTHSLFSFYKESELVTDFKKGTTLAENKIIGVMTSRPMHIVINNGDKDSRMDAYYVDYLCVDRNYRKKGIAPQIIQTHHYNQRHINKNIAVSLFKREEELTGIIPLCVYKTYGFSMRNWFKPAPLHAMYKLVLINEQNFHILADFIQEHSYQFDIVIYAEFSNMLELIKTKNIFVYILLEENKVNNILGAYFYRKTCVYYEKDLEILTCFASINGLENGNGNGKDIDSIFIQGFKISFWETAEKNYFGFAVIENISHNHLIIDNVCLKTKPVAISPTAYFFYNFAYPSFPSNKVLVIN